LILKNEGACGTGHQALLPAIKIARQIVYIPDYWNVKIGWVDG
jgi:hypothetical protein